jgi:hypothetical protein
LSRIRILALFATLVALASVFAACGGGGDDSSEDPQKVVESASLEGVKSGELDLSMHVTAEGDEGGEVDISLSGPFEQGAKGELPQADLTLAVDASGDGENFDFEGGLTLLTDRAFVEYEGTSYEVDPTTYGFLKSNLEQAEQREGSEAGVTACQKAAEGIKFSQFTDNLENEGGADVDGTSTTKVSGDVSVSGFFQALVKLLESPACASQLEAAGPLPLDELSEAEEELAKAVKKTHVDLYVGDDDIVRKLAMEMTIAPPEADGEKANLEVEATLSGVNEEQSFSKPEDAKPLEALFRKIGVNPLELLELGSGGGIEGLLEGVTGGSSGGGSSTGGDSEPNSSAAEKAYVQCLQEVKTSADLQKCASLLE